MTTRVDFYQLSRDPVERVAVMLARKVMQAQQKLVIVSRDADQRAAISKALWKAGPDEFLANGEAGSDADARQPILLASEPVGTHGASMIMFADGLWHEDALTFERALLLFDGDATDGARSLWRDLDGKDDVTREIHKQDEDGRWRAGD